MKSINFTIVLLLGVLSSLQSSEAFSVGNLDIAEEQLTSSVRQVQPLSNTDRNAIIQAAMQLAPQEIAARQNAIAQSHQAISIATNPQEESE